MNIWSRMSLMVPNQYLWTFYRSQTGLDQLHSCGKNIPLQWTFSAVKTSRLSNSKFENYNNTNLKFFPSLIICKVIQKSCMHCTAVPKLLKSSRLIWKIKSSFLTIWPNFLVGHKWFMLFPKIIEDYDKLVSI